MIGPSSRSTHSGCARGPSWPSAWRCWWRSSSYRRAAPGRQTPTDDPLTLFSVRSFSVANLVTFVVYGALSAGIFLVTVFVQLAMGYSALAAGAAGLPVTVLLALFSSRVGGLTEPVGSALVPHGGSDRDGARTHLAEHPGPPDRPTSPLYCRP